MKKVSVWVVVFSLLAGTASAQQAQEKEWVSPGLVLTGLLTSIAGAGVALHWGRDEYRVLGDTYCVGDYSVDYGNCNSPTETRIGLGMMGAGALLMFIGSRAKTKKFTLYPVVSKTVAGASVKMVW